VYGATPSIVGNACDLSIAVWASFCYNDVKLILIRAGELIVIRPCKHCEKLFTPLRSNGMYCEVCTQDATRPRVCEQCHGFYTLLPPHPSRLGAKYCSDACRLLANRQVALDAAAKARVERGRVLVRCALADTGACPRPDELISVVRSKAGSPRYHVPECNAARYRAGGGRKGTGEGRILSCKKCGKEIGYCSPSETRQYCGDCARHIHKGQPKPRGQGQWHECATPACPERVYVAPWEERASITGKFYCAAHDGRFARRTAVRARCVTCQRVSRFHKSKVPLSVDQKTHTWTCLACRPYKTAMRSFVCLHCHRSFRRRAEIEATATQEHFCDASCRRAYYQGQREQAPPCLYCGRTIQRRGRQKTYCDWECYTAAKVGRPHKPYRTSKAEQRIVNAWDAGVRGVRPLARASTSSVNTVQKLIKAGKIAS